MTLFSLRVWRTTLVVARNTETSRGFGVFTAMLRKEDVASMRRNYEMPDGFDESHLVAKEPFMQFDAWFREASKSPNIGEANAMILSTCGRDCRPTARVVLLKGYDNTGFTFFTNYNSSKAGQLKENPYASLLFYWDPLHRQVRVEGRVEKLSQKESEEYFHSRPRSSQIGAIVSNQSSVIASRKVLEVKEKELKEQYADDQKVIPKPDNWGGFKVIPDKVEFWQGQSSRLHDRIVFRKQEADEVLDENVTKKGDNGWVYERLSP